MNEQSQTPSDTNEHHHAGWVDGWKEILRDLPDVRLDKVLASRRSLGQQDYDCDAVLDKTAERLCQELGILGRQELN